MPRANRYFLRGHIWHITHRCHQQEFLLKFAKDRRAWRYWAYQARRRYGLCILNYAITSNHVHLLVKDMGIGEIDRGMQLISGRVAQQFNRRKLRKGAFWDDRYHATAVQADSHLARCMVYIDLNMVRTGVVKHPSEWPFSGYNEIQTPPRKYSLIDRRRLMSLFGFDDSDRFSKVYQGWVEDILRTGGHSREAKWTQSIAIGSKSFVEDIKDKLGFRAIGRKVVGTGDGYELKENVASYSNDFGAKMSTLRPENSFKWRVYEMNSK